MDYSALIGLNSEFGSGPANRNHNCELTGLNHCHRSRGLSRADKVRQPVADAHALGGSPHCRLPVKLWIGPQRDVPAVGRPRNSTHAIRHETRQRPPRSRRVVCSMVQSSARASPNRSSAARKSAASRCPMTRTELLRVNGWLIVAHNLFLEQVEALIADVIRDRVRRPDKYRTRRAAKMLAAVAHLAFQEIPEDPARDKYQQGNTLGDASRHWRRVKFYQQHRLFFRYRADADGGKAIVYAWVNDDDTKRAYGSKTDAYAVFKRMLDGGNPPDDWVKLKAACDAANEDQLTKVLADVNGLLAHRAARSGRAAPTTIRRDCSPALTR